MIAKLKKIEMMTTMAHSRLFMGNIDTIVLQSLKYKIKIVFYNNYINE
jgi:hypothetical protein